MQAPSGTHSNGIDVIENGIDLIRGSDLNRPLGFPGMEREPTVGACAICGRSLTQDGRCFRCLADLGFLSGSQEPGQSETPRRLTPGLLKYDHFEVEVGVDGFPIELGSGAMAITYRARDTVLNSVVALKVIDRKIAENPGARSRFLREARLAAQIRHPNVARVTHYGEQDGECFYVMELVEGETLEARIRRDGPMPLALALEIIEQTARALAAAEACGVVHRDIKPSNIMLESDPGGCASIVKVIDYGIAKILNPEAERGAEQTQTGFIGTPAFASPEQFAPSEQTKIDTRSDIYSLGVTFWYLLSARVPFVGRTLREVAARQAEELPLEQLKNAHVPARVVALLQSMLAVDPAKRLQTARELLSAIHRCYAKFSTEARSRRKRFVRVAAGAILVLGATGFGAWAYQHVQSSAELERSIAVLPFENLSANGEDTYFTVGMQDEITDDLAKLAGMKVIGSQSTRSYPPGKERNLHAIGRDLGVRHLLVGTVSRDHDQMRVALQLVDLRDSGHPWTEEYQRAIKDVFALQGEITRAVAAQLQAALSPNEKAMVDAPPTDDLQAYDFYLQARALAAEILDGASFFRGGKRAIELLEQAVARDPKLVLAYCELAKWHDDLYFQRNHGPPEELAVDHRSLAEVALEKARTLQPGSGAVHLAVALHALKITKNLEEAQTQVELARRTLPNNAQVEAIAGRVARRQDRWDEAIRCFERAVSLEPRDLDPRNLLALSYRYMRRYDDYDRVMQSIIALTPPEKLGILPIERALAQLEKSADLGPLREAIATQMAAHQLDDDNADNTQMMLALWSHDAAAISSIISRRHGALGWNGIEYPDAWFAAIAARIRGDNSAAVKAFAIARPQLEKRVVAAPTNGIELSLLAIADAGLGRSQQAVEEGRRACDLAPFEVNNFDAPTVRCNLAVVYAWMGQNDLAIAELSKLLNRPAMGTGIAQPTYGDFRLNPLWDPLRNDPRFEALVQRLAPVALH
ncbi:MAG: protein kinase domain-containing protein [Chthoniobacterales bacterium]